MISKMMKSMCVGQKDLYFNAFCSKFYDMWTSSIIYSRHAMTTISTIFLILKFHFVTVFVSYSKHWFYWKSWVDQKLSTSIPTFFLSYIYIKKHTFKIICSYTILFFSIGSNNGINLINSNLTTSLQITSLHVRNH